MSLLDTLLNIASASAANRRAFEYTKALQQHQYDLNQQALKSYYSNHRFSLEQAGYNPLLAVPGSTAQGFSASASMSPVMPGSSGAGTDEVNSAVNAINAHQQRKLVKQQVKGAELDNKHKELENTKLENEINTSPRNIISEIIKNGESKTGNSAISRLTALKNSYGLGFIQPRNFVKTTLQRAKNLANQVKSINSAKSAVNNGKPFELKATYNYHTGNGFEYRPDLDEKGKLPPELAKYHKR